MIGATRKSRINRLDGAYATDQESFKRTALTGLSSAVSLDTGRATETRLRCQSGLYRIANLWPPRQDSKDNHDRAMIQDS
jgi:hypothetical protein